MPLYFRYYLWLAGYPSANHTYVNIRTKVVTGREFGTYIPVYVRKYERVNLFRSCLAVSPTATGFKTNARPLARGELKSIRASGLPDMTSPAG